VRLSSLHAFRNTYPGINVQAQTSNSPIPIYIQGQKKSFDSLPILRDGRVFLPIRYISEYFGAQVTWNDQTKTVTVKQGSKTISLQIGNSIAQIDGKEVSLDVPAFITGHELTYRCGLLAKPW